MLNLRKSLITLCVALPMIVAMSCARDNNTDSASGSGVVRSTSSGNVVITVSDAIKGDINGDSTDPYIIAVLKNTGSETARGLECTVKARKNNTIVETVEADVLKRLNPANLEPGKSTAVEIVFTTFDNHDDYDDLEFSFNWDESYKGIVVVNAIISGVVPE